MSLKDFLTVALKDSLTVALKDSLRSRLGENAESMWGRSRCRLLRLRAVPRSAGMQPGVPPGRSYSYA